MSSTTTGVIDVALDPKERKRVLNVLAQRRYRRRKRESYARLQVLTDQAQAPSAHACHLFSADPSLARSNSNKSSDLPSITSGSSTSGVNLNVAHNADSPGSSTPSIEFDLSDFLQEDDVISTTFPDSFAIAVPELDLLRAARDNATRLQSQTILFDLNSLSIFMTGSYPSVLPEQLQPTSTQLSIPHHPVLDILPWPSVRDRLIKMFAMPDHHYSLVGLIYDLEDSGVRVWGNDPAQASNWEIQQKFLDSWWWALDRSVIQSSNERRRDRGETDLILPK